MKDKVEYTGWLYGIGVLGFINGIVVIFLSLVRALIAGMLFGIFLLLLSVLFLTIRNRMIYLMYMGMFAIICLVRTIASPLPSQPNFLGYLSVTFIYWLCFAYLIYKYFDLRAEFRKYEKPYGHEREKVESEDVPYYYKVLGVSKDATQEEIKRAYYRLVRIYHPDVSADPEARRKFEEIRKAYEVLSDPEKRAKYDKFEHAYRSGRY